MDLFEFSDSGNKPNREELLNMAINTAKAGNKEGARVMLRQILGEDKRNERALMWMARTSASRPEQKQWLERVLTVNPDNKQAQQQLKKINYRHNARENRTLLIFGAVTVVLILLVVVVVAGLLLLT
jgi:thioredoxin-like negative regulator of GroEL